MRNKEHKALDAIGCSIVEVLQKEATLSTAEIRRGMGLSAPAVAERMIKMQETGIIDGYYTSLNFGKLNLTIRAFTLFKAKNIDRPQ